MFKNFFSKYKSSRDTSVAIMAKTYKSLKHSMGVFSPRFKRLKESMPVNNVITSSETMTENVSSVFQNISANSPALMSHIHDVPTVGVEAVAIILAAKAVKIGTRKVLKRTGTNKIKNGGATPAKGPSKNPAKSRRPLNKDAIQGIKPTIK